MKLVLRTRQNEGRHPLYTRMRIEGEVQWVNMLVTVDVAEWNEAAKTQRKLSNYINKCGIGKKIAMVEDVILDLRRHHKLTKDTLNSAIEDIMLQEKREAFIQMEKLAKEIEVKKARNVKDFVIRYINDIKCGKVRTVQKERYSKNSVKNWRQFERVFLDFYEVRPFTWEEINEEFVDRYLSYLEQIGYMKFTIEKYISLLRTIVGVSERKGLHSNHVAQNLLRSPKITDADKAKEIYLSKDELTALYNVKLNGFEEKVRDVFLVGCYTAMRYSDYCRIRKSNIGVTNKGTRVIRLLQEKTGKPVVVPVLDERLVTLLKKYDYNVPMIRDQNLNRTIKKICKRLSESVPSLAKMERTKLTLEERRAEREAKKKGNALFEYDEQGYPIKPRWALVTTHTARRSCITNMYLSGKFTVAQMMSVSGHRKEAIFNHYVKLSLDEYADSVAISAVDGLF
ncbi:MAG: tyrosine-type recombinase/integrase [Bacteroidales bacterium]|nr:tyrosine-type recombinase/integrase [Bacteroidales bacterium]